MSTIINNNGFEKVKIDNEYVTKQMELYGYSYQKTEYITQDEYNKILPLHNSTWSSKNQFPNISNTPYYNEISGMLSDGTILILITNELQIHKSNSISETIPLSITIPERHGYHTTKNSESRLYIDENNNIYIIHSRLGENRYGATEHFLSVFKIIIHEQTSEIIKLAEEIQAPNFNHFYTGCGFLSNIIIKNEQIIYVCWRNYNEGTIYTYKFNNTTYICEPVDYIQMQFSTTTSDYYPSNGYYLLTTINNHIFCLRFSNYSAYDGIGYIIINNDVFLSPTVPIKSLPQETIAKDLQNVVLYRCNDSLYFYLTNGNGIYKLNLNNLEWEEHYNDSNITYNRYRYHYLEGPLYCAITNSVITTTASPYKLTLFDNLMQPKQFNTPQLESYYPFTSYPTEWFIKNIQIDNINNLLTTYCNTSITTNGSSIYQKIVSSLDTSPILYTTV